MNVLVEYKDCWESQYQNVIMIDTDKLDKNNPTHVMVLESINKAIADEDKSHIVNDDVYKAIEIAMEDAYDGKDSFILPDVKGVKVDEHIDLWYNE